MNHSRTRAVVRHVALVLFLVNMPSPGLGDPGTGSSGRSSGNKRQCGIVNFRVTPSTIKPGESAMLQWQVENADVVAVTPAVQQFGTNSAMVKPSSTTTYALNVAGPDGAAIQFLTLPVGNTGSTPPAPATGSTGAKTPSAVPVAPAVDSGSDDKHPLGYTLIWSDDFHGTTPDRVKWCTRLAHGGGARLEYDDVGCTGPGDYQGTLDFLNAEQQRYVDHNSRGETMHVMANGVLRLRATRTRNDSYAKYESAMIRSKAAFKPGGATSYFIVSRVRLPNVKGSWPAFWLVSGFDSKGGLLWPPEVDIFEGALNGLGEKTNMLRMGGIARGGRQTRTGDLDFTFTHPDYLKDGTHYAPARNLRDTWLLTAAEWTESGLCYFVDGLRVMCENYRWITDEGASASPANVIVNLAIGGEWAGAAGIDDVFFPTGMDVDYVRVYRR